MQSQQLRQTLHCTAWLLQVQLLLYAQP
jgi:hypothetical protein